MQATANANVSVEPAPVVCSVCDEKYNRSRLMPVKCDFCDYSACRECYKRYILNSTENCHCMNCRKQWEMKVLVKKFERTFINNEYKKHRENILIEREKGLMVATQPIVERLIKVEQTRNEVFELRNQIQEIQKKINMKERELHQILTNTTAGEQEKHEFVRKCTYADCKGFLSSRWKCGLCEMWSCPDCFEVKGPASDGEHTCDPNTLETAKLLKKDTKPCPKCGTMIFKIDGCAQMWCTDCHTPFNWNTMRIENGVVHNPHYFEWMRRSGNHAERNLQEVRCGREIDHHFCSSFSRVLGSFTHRIGFSMTVEETKTELTKLRNIIHIRMVEIPRFNVNVLQENENLRIGYMRNKITEEDFKVMLQKKEKQMQKKQEIANILATFMNCMTEIIYRMTELMRTYTDNRSEATNMFLEMMDEKNNLTTYTNQCLSDVSAVYKCKEYKISYDTYQLL
jgi:hypothetical protein